MANVFDMSFNWTPVKLTWSLNGFICYPVLNDLPLNPSLEYTAFKPNPDTVGGDGGGYQVGSGVENYGYLDWVSSDGETILTWDKYLSTIHSDFGMRHFWIYGTTGQNVSGVGGSGKIYQGGSTLATIPLSSSEFIAGCGMRDDGILIVAVGQNLFVEKNVQINFYKYENEIWTSLGQWDGLDYSIFTTVEYGRLRYLDNAYFYQGVYFNDDATQACTVIALSTDLKRHPLSRPSEFRVETVYDVVFDVSDVGFTINSIGTIDGGNGETRLEYYRDWLGVPGSSTGLLFDWTALIAEGYPLDLTSEEPIYMGYIEKAKIFHTDPINLIVALDFSGQVLENATYTATVNDRSVSLDPTSIPIGLFIGFRFINNTVNVTLGGVTITHNVDYVYEKNQYPTDNEVYDITGFFSALHDHIEFDFVDLRGGVFIYSNYHEVGDWTGSFLGSDKTVALSHKSRKYHLYVRGNDFVFYDNINYNLLYYPSDPLYFNSQFSVEGGSSFYYAGSTIANTDFVFNCSPSCNVPVDFYDIKRLVDPFTDPFFYITVDKNEFFWENHVSVGTLTEDQYLTYGFLGGYGDHIFETFIDFGDPVDHFALYKGDTSNYEKVFFSYDINSRFDIYPSGEYHRMNYLSNDYDDPSIYIDPRTLVNADTLDVIFDKISVS